MSSETSTDRDQLQPWQFFTLAALAGATAVVFVTRESSPAAAILLSLTIGAAAFVGVTAWRTLGPLAGVRTEPAIEVLGGRTRAALEREKTLVLRAIKDLEFDRAMGKVSEKDFTEMSARLRARGAGLLRQLDRDVSYRDAIERELADRLRQSGDRSRPRQGSGGQGHRTDAPRAAASCACGTTNDPDARFCKTCGQKLAAA
jgi:hypothetical protein